MKTTWMFLTCLSLFLLTSCQKDEKTEDRMPGRLCIHLDLFLHVDQQEGMLKAAPELDDFIVNVYHSDGSLVTGFERLSLMPDTLELESGDYYVEAYSDNNLPAAFLNPYYHGMSEIFSIGSNETHTIQVLCELANTIVSVSYSDNIRSRFEDFQTTVSSSEGSLVYVKDEIQLGYFMPLPLDIRVDLEYRKPDGSLEQKVLQGSIPAPEAKKHYEIRVDANIQEGMAEFLVLLDSSEVLVEVIPIGEDNGSPVIGSLAYGDLLITEIMYDPSALPDTEGEWLEIYNRSGQIIDLQGLILDRDGTSQHTIRDEILVSPGGYAVLARTSAATTASDYNYGSAITLPNSGAVLSLFNEDSGSGPGSLIFSLDYGASGFPDGSGASISLHPASQDPASAQLPGSWCVATSSFDTGDMGTPGEANDPCQIVN